MKPKVLLINPDPQVPANPPLGLLYVAASLEDAGFETRVHDMGFDRTQSKFEQLIAQWRPEVIGISCTTPLYPHARRLAARVKGFLPSSWVVLGGIHPSVAPERSLSDSEADIAATGEGERLMVEVVRVYPEIEAAAAMPGVYAKTSKGIVHGPPPEFIQNLDKLPLPARHLVDVPAYFKASGHDRIKWSLPQPSLPVIASRGCPYRCAFCASELVHGRAMRLRSIANIQGEIESLMSRYGIKGVYFYDDTLTFDVAWLEGLCAMLSGLGLKWICGTRLDRVNRPILEMMKASGCVVISYGIESGDEYMLQKVLKKGLTLRQIKDNMKLTHEVGISTIANYMLGVPGESKESMKKTIRLSRELDSDVAEFSIYMPLPGTELALAAERSGTFVQADLSKFDYMRPTYSDTALPPDLVKKYHSIAVRGFYLRPRYLVKRLLRIRTWQDVKANLMGLRSLLSIWRRVAGC
ncbi:MAG: radical SAM protein [Candidatus Abyssubacteria bacterium]